MALNPPFMSDEASTTSYGVSTVLIPTNWSCLLFIFRKLGIEKPLVRVYVEGRHVRLDHTWGSCILNSPYDPIVQGGGTRPWISFSFSAQLKPPSKSFCYHKKTVRAETLSDIRL
jgi:hypothetical protein